MIYHVYTWCIAVNWGGFIDYDWALYCLQKSHDPVLEQAAKDLARAYEKIDDLKQILNHRQHTTKDSARHSESSVDDSHGE